MREQINQEVSVVSFFSAKKRLSLPHIISWQGREYAVGKIGFHHTVRHGETLHHIFELVDQKETLWMRLNLNTANLHWTLEAVSDGEAD
jgi:acyl dehydratase